MANLILFDDDSRDKLLPLAYTRPVCEFRVGILTIREKWEKYLNAKASYITQEYLAKKYPIQIADDNLVVNGALLPNRKLVLLFRQLKKNEAVLYHDELLAARLDKKQFENLNNNVPIAELSGYDLSKDDSIQLVDELWKIFYLNREEIRKDFQLITKGRKSQAISHSNTIIGTGDIFLEPGAKVEAAVLNSDNGPIYIGRNAEIMEGSTIRGPFAMNEHSLMKMGSRIYGPVTLGPYCKIGGEVNSSVLFGYSNKSHEGYLGNSVLGEWCNLGANTNISNLKNNYTNIKLWNYKEQHFVDTGKQFCGLILADHAKSGISVMFNTGTVVGVASNIFGTGYPRNFIPSFAWGGEKGYQTYRLRKVFDTMELVMSRRGKKLTENDKEILEHIFDISSKYRHWEK